MHVIKLDGYNATVDNGEKLELGTFDSYGEEQLQIVKAPDWENLSVIATFNPPYKKPVQAVVDSVTGVVKVPKEATADSYGVGAIVFVGLADGVQRITSDVEYIVSRHSNASGTEPAEPTPDLLQQVLTLSKDAQTAAKNAVKDAAAAKANADKAQADAEKAQQAAENAAADAAKAGPYAEAARAAQEAAESARDEAISAQQAAENAAAAAAASKSAADTLATEAARAALAAENSKAAANNAANFAGENATAAQQAAATATAAANDAGQSASGAAASKAAAETAAKAAQDAQTAAAAAKAEAVKAQGAAQTAAKSAQDAQAAAEKVRDDAKAAQKGAEAARDTAAKSAEAAAKSEANAKQSADTLAESVENVVANTAAVAELKQQVENITPDDSTIGGKPWSSKHIIDMLCPPLEESGNPVVCYPVAGYPLGVKAKWEPMQEGSGTPYPAGGGKNLWGDLIQNTFVSQQGISSGYSGAKTTGKIPCAEGDKYTLSCATTFAPAPGNIGVLAYFDASDAMLTRVANTSQRAFTLTAPDNVAYLRASCLSETDADNVQLEKGSDATDYVPYENIRPIKGRDSVAVERCGENLVKLPYLTSSVNKNGLVITSQQDGSITVDGTATADTWYTVENDIEKRLPINTPMALSGCPAGGSTKSYFLGLFLGRKWFPDSGNGNTDIKFTTREFASRVQVSIAKGTVCNNLTFYPKIEVGTTITPYSKYQGSTNTLTLPETVYGGEVDAVAGEGTIAKGCFNLDDATNWEATSYAENNDESGYGFMATYPKSPIAGDGKECWCSHLPYNWGLTSGYKSTGILVHENGQVYVRVKIDGVNSVETWIAYLAAQKTAGTPVQACYKLEEPVPFTATGAQPIHALAGANTVLTDADSATVTGRADPIKRITDLEAAVASIN